MHLLVVGANGLLGSNVVRAALEREWIVSGSYHSTDPGFDIPLSQLDVTETDAVRALIDSVDPDWVVNCAAMTDVDSCEQAPDRAAAINSRAPGEIAACCNNGERNLCHVSTDYMFDGASRRRYAENAATNPLQRYGESKRDGDTAVRESLPDAVITRLSFVYGVHRAGGTLTGFPAWVRDRLRSGDNTPLFTDQHVTPSRAGQAAETICELIDADASGTFNVACRSCVSPFEFGAAIRNRMAADETLLIEANRSEIEQPASRPAHTCLDVTKTESTLRRPQPSLSTDLSAIADWLGMESGGD